MTIPPALAGQAIRSSGDSSSRSACATVMILSGYLAKRAAGRSANETACSVLGLRFLLEAVSAGALAAVGVGLDAECVCDLAR
jgi:hypothetical protein